MSSSRSIAAARNRRAGEAPATSQSRPGTSINSQPAFQQRQRQPPQQQQPQQQPQQQQPRYTQQQQQQQQKQVPAPTQNVKLSVSDAIGLITLRLGRVEQILIDQQHEAAEGSTGFKIPDGTQLFDKSVMNSIINRLDSLEKRDKEKSFSQDIDSIKSDIATKLIVLNEKMENHVTDTERRFVDIENAFVELENSFSMQQEFVEQQVEQEEQQQNITLEKIDEEDESQDLPASSVFSLDLKNIVSKELKNI